MTLSFLRAPKASLRAPLGALAFVAAMGLAIGAARAQGTDAQREACTPDALKLCQATIPDIDKTTACMKAHFAQLSPRCKVAFNAATGPAAAPRRERPHREAVAPPPREDEDTDVAATPAPTPGMESTASDIRRYCREGLIDPFTCRNSLAALRSAE